MVCRIFIGHHVPVILSSPRRGAGLPPGDDNHRTPGGRIADRAGDLVVYQVRQSWNILVMSYIVAEFSPEHATAFSLGAGNGREEIWLVVEAQEL